MTVAESVIREVRQESGFVVRVSKLAAALDRTRQGHPDRVFSCCKLFFICELIGGIATNSLEVSEVAWFAENSLPTDLSLGRVLPALLRRIFLHARNPSMPTDFD